jgi:hypothetical protein
MYIYDGKQVENKLKSAEEIDKNNERIIIIFTCKIQT